MGERVVMRGQTLRTRLAAVLAAATVIAAASGSSAARAHAPIAPPALAADVSPVPMRASGTLQISATIPQRWRLSREFCPPGTPAAVDCLQSVGEGVITGLGRVTVTYYKLLPYEEGCFILHNNGAVIEVAGKGTLAVSREGRSCAAGPPPREDGPVEFAVASGSGRYAGASGSLAYRSSVAAGNAACRCGTASDTWTGTLTVPGVEFDLSPPVLTGAVSKTVRAPKKKRRVRVRYRVVAEDAVEGRVPVGCSPRSGSPFKRGRTRVTCTATDSSGNALRARFVITVR